MAAFYSTSAPSNSAPLNKFEWYSSSDSQIMLFLSCVTCTTSLLVILLCARYPHIRRKTYVEMVFYSCVCDFFGGISTIFGEQQDGSIICWTQGIMSNVFPLSSIAWTCAMACLLYSMVVFHRPIVVSKYLHIVCWGLPICLTLLPLTTSNYGAIDGVGWCFLTNRSDSPPWALTFWVIASFYFWVALAILFLATILVIIYYVMTMKLQSLRTIRTMRGHLDYAARRDAGIKILWLYPIVIILCWSVTAATDIYNTLHEPFQNRIVDALALSLPILQGCFTALIFIYSTKAVRRKITSLFNIFEKPILDPHRQSNHRRWKGIIRKNMLGMPVAWSKKNAVQPLPLAAPYCNGIDIMCAH